MSIIKNIIESQRSLNVKETTLSDENGDEQLIKKAKLNSLLREFEEVEEELTTLRKMIDESKPS